MHQDNSRICLALDGLTLERALELTAALGPLAHAVKCHDLYDAYGPRIIGELKKAGARRLWIDYKLDDTKKTVTFRTQALLRNGVNIITVHASGGVPMMEAALDAVFTDCGPAAEIWAITVLTSLDPEEIGRIFGKDRAPQKIVLDFALMAGEAGVNGIVCSAEEVGMLRRCEDLAGTKLIVPGTRSVGVALGQQKRSGTPAQAIVDGATYLVAGSQVTEADDPVAAFKAMAAEIGMRI